MGKKVILLMPHISRISRLLFHRVRFSGNYSTWADARRHSSEYSQEAILKKVAESTRKVRDGVAAYERDSVLFDRIEYSWPLLASLLWIASKSGNRLDLIDFGGSLGSTYYQNYFFLSHLNPLNWNIVEQENFVLAGKREFENQHVSFYSNFEKCFENKQPSTVLFSSVLQYLPEPFELLRKVFLRKPYYILLDRTPFLPGDSDRITIQKVPKSIYKATYPAWFFNENKFLEFFSGSYEMIAEFKSSDRANIRSTYKGFLFQRRK